jgi:hypothetical protein
MRRERGDEGVGADEMMWKARKMAEMAQKMTTGDARREGRRKEEGGQRAVMWCKEVSARVKRSEWTWTEDPETAAR